MVFEEYQKMADFEKYYWWHMGKLSLVRTLMKMVNKPSNSDILEIGCGTGGVLKVLKEFGNAHGTDVSNEALRLCKDSGEENVWLSDFETLTPETFPHKFDTILALDVLEHVQEDTLAMKNALSLLKPEGVFVVTVPAHKFLWSTHDEALHHKRRYHSYELTKKLEQAGFEIVKKSYFVSIVFPAILLYRLWGNIFGRDAFPKTSYVLLPSFLNTVLANMLGFEASLLKTMDIPFGTSLVVIAKKK